MQNRTFQFRIRTLLATTALIALSLFAYNVITRKPRFITTAFWTNVPPPSDAQVKNELAESVREWITIDGAAHVQNGKAAIWISEEIVIVAVDRADWPDRPSHRSHVMVTGFLTQNDGQYEIDRTTFEWVDQ